MARLHLAPFDRDRDFITHRAFLCRGVNYERDKPFDKESVSIRTLRILYEGRSIGYVEEAPLAGMSEGERELLEGRPRKFLVSMASGLGINTPPRASKRDIIAEIARTRDVAPSA